MAVQPEFHGQGCAGFLMGFIEAEVRQRFWGGKGVMGEREGSERGDGGVKGSRRDGGKYGHEKQGAQDGPGEDGEHGGVQDGGTQDGEQNGGQEEGLVMLLTGVREITGSFYGKRGFKVDYEVEYPMGFLGSSTGFAVSHRSKRLV